MISIQTSEPEVAVIRRGCVEERGEASSARKEEQGSLRAYQCISYFSCRRDKIPGKMI